MTKYEKRKMGIKDYGKLIPGHGGIMDRFDSIIFTAPVIFYLTALFFVVVILGLVVANRKKPSITTGIWAAIGGLAILNVVIAVFWH